MGTPRTVLLTGAAGGVGTFLRESLPGYGYELRLFDKAPIPGEPQAVTADLADAGALAAAMTGVDAVVHLAGLALEAPFPDILTANIEGTLYGLSKCFGEDLAALYADKHGITTVSLRIGSCYAEPRTVRMLATWLSPADCARLVHAAIGAELSGHHVVYGISANTRGWWDLEPGHRLLGYRPQDDAEVYAAKLLAAQGELAAEDPEFRYLGGAFTTF
ncbi:NAD-dependent epimerase/dehydratase family protein [Kitasatospora sp. NBC_01266]|uniref:NAD-dependent epimerase/dehydratase family protein n=1 Tax=Kitasatospora sp. NBC_01266 TaxID=2903572 RepID=UPI002E35859B|nr:NAD(P)-dependent oxidoreductase [Kitasatospora sp. NBC_01266]